MSKPSAPQIVTFKSEMDGFYFLGYEQAVTNRSSFGAVWDNYFKAAKKAGFGNYEYIVWYYKNGNQMYFVGKMADAATDVPEEFSLVKFPSCEYLVVTHDVCKNLHDGIGITQKYAGIGQTHDYKENIQLPEGYARYDGPDDPITQIERENAGFEGGGRFERWVPIRKST
jgi:predicted transcriptional regulator YdeE